MSAIVRPARSNGICESLIDSSLTLFSLHANYFCMKRGKEILLTIENKFYLLSHPWMDMKSLLLR